VVVTGALLHASRADRSTASARAQPYVDSAHATGYGHEAGIAEDEAGLLRNVIQDTLELHRVRGGWCGNPILARCTDLMALIAATTVTL
jgi:hypothetical protein